MVKIKGRIYDKSREEGWKGKTLIVEKLKLTTYEDLIKNIDKVNDMLEKAAKKGVYIDITPDNLGVDKKGNLKLLDFHFIRPTYGITEDYKENLNFFVRTAKNMFGEEKSKHLKKLLKNIHKTK